MFKDLIITIAITAVLQSIINVITPENHTRSIIISATNIIFSSAILIEILGLIQKLLSS